MSEMLQSSGAEQEVQDLSEASLQAFAYMSRELGRLMSSLKLARRQVWLAQSPLSEASRRALRTLPVVPGQLFWVAAKQALERTLQVTQARQQFASLRRAPPRSRRPPVSTTTVPPIPRPLTRAGAPLLEGFRQPTRSRPFRQPQQNAAQGYRPPRGHRGRGGRQ